MNRARHLIDKWLTTNAPPNNSYAELDSAQTTDTSQQVVSTSVQQVGCASASLNKWQKPQLGRIKGNIDASLWNCTGIGICLCDEDSEYVLAKTMSLSRLKSKKLLSCFIRYGG